MKKLIVIMIGCLITATANAQQNKKPVMVRDAPTLANTSANLYYDYADQGNRMYINNSHFQNKDNVTSNSFPATNGQYLTPGNSNPINRNLNEGSLNSSGIIYSGYVPVRNYGNHEERQNGPIR